MTQNRSTHSFDCPHDGDQIVSVVVGFNASRARVTKTELGGQQLSPGKQRRSVWTARMPARAARGGPLTIEWTGERPDVLRVLTCPEPEEAVCIERVAEALDQTVIHLLEKRAAREFDEHPHAHRFFLCFDAWTQPDVTTVLQRAEQALDEKARAIFFPRNEPFVFESIGVLVPIAEFLLNSVCDRASTFVKGIQLPAPPPPENLHDVLAMSGTTYDAAMSDIAQHLESLFDTWFPGATRMDAAALDGLATAFSLFASGALRFVELTAQGLDDRLNCEPDSSLFFAFAEYSLRAAETAHPDRRAFWAWMARLGVGLQDVFCATYGPTLGPRTIHAYDRQNRGSRPSIDLVSIRGHLARQQYRSADPLVDVTRRHAMNAAYAFRDTI